MMKKKILLSVTSFVALIGLGLSSCSSTDNRGIAPEEGEQTYASKSALRVHFALPRAEGVNYARALHDQREYAINKVTLYIFDTETNKLLLEPIAIEGSALTAGSLGSNGDYTYTLTHEQENALGDRKLVNMVAVANETPNITLSVGDDVSKLEAVLARKAQPSVATAGSIVGGATDNENIVMTGRVNQVPLSNMEVTIPMVRIVARIDIINNVAPNPKTGESVFTIDKVVLRNANSKSILLDDGIANVATGSQKVSGVTPFQLTAEDTSVGGTFQNSYKKVFYLYEGVQPDAKDEATTVELYYTYFGKKYMRTIPFWDDKANKGVEIKRNHLYRIIVGTPDVFIPLESKLTFTLQDNPWNEEVIMQGWRPFSVAYTQAGTQQFDATKREVTIDKTAQTIEFGYKHELATEPTVRATVSEGASWLTVTTSQNGKIILNATANDTTDAVEREAVVTITYSGNAAYTKSYKIKQGK